MDWFSLYVLSWEVSTSLETDFCITALDKAFDTGFCPEIVNTDQGVQFTSNLFTEQLKKQSILIRMDGRGRALDNIFVERLWRSLKYEEVYIRDYQSVSEGKHYLNEYLT